MIGPLRAFTSLLLATALVTGCKGSASNSSGASASSASPQQAAAGKSGAPLAVGAPGSNVVGNAGTSAWDSLSDKEAVKTFGTLYLHQSVGQDLEDGAEALGYKFEYYGPDHQRGQATAQGLNGGIFTDVAGVANGAPMEKMAAVRKALATHKSRLKVLFFSFGYADVQEQDLPAVEAAYAKLVADVKAAGLRFVHVTPPLVYSVAENPPKMKMRTWMLETFKGDTIFDLQDIESTQDGKRCEVGGVWRICQGNRSTTTCPSKGQGIDEEGAGHICATRAKVFAKALLFAIHRAGR